MWTYAPDRINRWDYSLSSIRIFPWNQLILFVIVRNINYILIKTFNMEADTSKTILIFLINGINSLLGWNAVLAALDYFQAAF